MEKKVEADKALDEAKKKSKEKAKIQLLEEKLVKEKQEAKEAQVKAEKARFIKLPTNYILFIFSKY